jgi:hypothetical protein
MQTLGRGIWVRHNSKTTTESCYTLDISAFARRGLLRDRGSGVVTWTTPYTLGPPLTARWKVQDSLGTQLVLEFSYRCYQTDVTLPIQLQTTRPHYGGIRWWWTCPMVNDGITCGRRVAKLHRPPNRHLFGCRDCHDLTYRSCQESHLTQREYVRMGFNPDDVASHFTSAGNLRDIPSLLR